MMPPRIRLILALALAAALPSSEASIGFHGDGSADFGSDRRPPTEWNARTGEILQINRRLREIDGWHAAFAGPFWYLIDKGGLITVLTADRKLQLVSRNRLGDWPHGADFGVSNTGGPMFFAGDRIYVRHFRSLYCILESDSLPEDVPPSIPSRPVLFRPTSSRSPS